jgi:hypothetical protein
MLAEFLLVILPSSQMRPGALDHYVVASIKGQQIPFGDDNQKGKGIVADCAFAIPLFAMGAKGLAAGEENRRRQQQIPHSASLRAGSAGMTTRRAKAKATGGSFRCRPLLLHDFC